MGHLLAGEYQTPPPPRPHLQADSYLMDMCIPSGWLINIKLSVAAAPRWSSPRRTEPNRRRAGISFSTRGRSGSYLLCSSTPGGTEAQDIPVKVWRDPPFTAHGLVSQRPKNHRIQYPAQTLNWWHLFYTSCSWMSDSSILKKKEKGTVLLSLSVNVFSHGELLIACNVEGSVVCEMTRVTLSPLLPSTRG